MWPFRSERGASRLPEDADAINLTHVLTANLFFASLKANDVKELLLGGARARAWPKSPDLGAIPVRQEANRREWGQA
jgi:hypothetical protein